VTKLKMGFGLLLALGLGVLALSVAPWDIPDRVDAPRPHTPPHVIAQRPGQTLRFSVNWERPADVPERIVFHVAGTQETLTSAQLSPELGRWSLEVPYDPKVTYALEAWQTNTNAGLTVGEIRILGPGLGFGDSDRINQGRGTLRCWVNAGI
jgi:hypothetical protein